MLALSLALCSCGSPEQPVGQVLKERDEAKQEVARLREELALRSKPEADAIASLQADMAKAKTQADAEQARLRQQIDQLGKQQVLVELAPLQDFLKQSKQEAEKTRATNILLAKDVQAMARSLGSHVQSEEAAKAAQDAAEALLDAATE
jgi:hypothetical protein